MTHKTTLIIQLPFDITKERRERLCMYALSSILSNHLWDEPVQKSMTFSASGYDNTKESGNMAEFRTVLTSDMNADERIDVALKLINWMMLRT